MHRFRSLFSLVVAFIACALLSSQAFAVELTSDVSLVRGSWRSNLTYSAVSGFGNNCQSVGSYLINGVGNDNPCYLSSISMSTWDGNYNVGDFIVQELYVHNTQVNNASDVLARFNSYYLSTTGNAGADLVNVKFENLNESSSKIIFTSRVWQAGNIYSITYGFQQYAAFGLYNAEYLASGYTSVWHEKNAVDYNTTLGNISTVLSNIESGVWNAANNVWGITQDTASMRTTLGTVSGNVSDIKQLIQNNNTAINNQTQTMQDIHDDEKQTIEDNGDAAQGNFEDFTPTLTFSDPLSWLWSLGTSERCASIPILASLIHSQETIYCTWWSTSIRSVVSPIINIFVLVIVFGFAIRWLKSGGM